MNKNLIPLIIYNNRLLLIYFIIYWAVDLMAIRMGHWSWIKQITTIALAQNTVPKKELEIKKLNMIYIVCNIDLCLHLKRQEKSIWKCRLLK